MEEKQEAGTSESVEEKKKAQNEPAATYLVCFIVLIKICRIIKSLKLPNRAEKHSFKKI